MYLGKLGRLSGKALATLGHYFCCFVQELSPTTDANMVKSHMNLMDTMMDEFHDEQKFKELNEREVAAWLEVWLLLRFFVSFL